MMLHYNELAADLTRIRRFLMSSSTKRQTPDERRFAYIACISALYSSFENFVERVAFRFTEMLLADPTNLSAEQLRNLRRRYVRNASTLLGQTLGVGRYREVTEFDVAKSLASCLDDAATSFDLRLELIALHSSNLRWEPLAELFKWAVPDLQSRIKDSDAVEKWMSLNVNVSERTLASVLAGELEDLVERRNEVAHRAIPDEILSHENLLDKVLYIEAICLGLVASLAGLLLDISIKKGESVPLGTPAAYYKNHRVVVISAIESPVSEGDYVLAPGRNSARWGRILEIRVNDEVVPYADAGTEVGLRLDFAARKRGALHLWHTPNSDLAYPPEGIFGRRGPLEAD
jgi:hypothetical protein